MVNLYRLIGLRVFGAIVCGVCDIIFDNKTESGDTTILAYIAYLTIFLVTAYGFFIAVPTIAISIMESK
jgi:hypothetical protein